MALYSIGAKGGEEGGAARLEVLTILSKEAAHVRAGAARSPLLVLEQFLGASEAAERDAAAALALVIVDMGKYAEPEPFPAHLYQRSVFKGLVRGIPHWPTGNLPTLKASDLGSILAVHCEMFPLFIFRKP